MVAKFPSLHFWLHLSDFAFFRVREIWHFSASAAATKEKKEFLNFREVGQREQGHSRRGPQLGVHPHLRDHPRVQQSAGHVVHGGPDRGGRGWWRRRGGGRGGGAVRVLQVLQPPPLRGALPRAAVVQGENNRVTFIAKRPLSIG